MALIKRAFWAGKKLGVSSQFLEEEIGKFKYEAITPGRIRIDLDDGTYVGIAATLVLHYAPNSGEPYKGGIRMSDKVTLDDLQFLAFDMTSKQGVVGIPFGGAKLGIELGRPKNTFSSKEIFRIIEETAKTFISIGFLGPNIYVPATDIGTTAEHMDAIHTVYTSMKWDDPFLHACVTGKSERNHGLPVRKIATALGGIEVFKALRKLGALPELTKVKKLKVNVQGLGNVGGWFVRLAAEHGLLITGVSNSKGAVYNPHGIDISELPASGDAPLDHVTGTHMDNTTFLTQPCDILVPAAREGQITEKNAWKICAKVILELANGPVTDEADKLLKKRGVRIIPDILANAGGVTASWGEYAFCKDKPHHSLELEKINQEATARIIAVMTDATEKVLDYAKKYDVDLREAACLKSMDTIAESWRRHQRRIESGRK